MRWSMRPIAGWRAAGASTARCTAAAGRRSRPKRRGAYPAGCPTGSAVITSGGELPARWVIHAVGPVWQGGHAGEAALLESAYRSSFELASQHGCRTIALPALSCGVYGYPVDAASRIALSAARKFLEQDTVVEHARFVLFGPGMYGAFSAALEELGG